MGEHEAQKNLGARFDRQSVTLIGNPSQPPRVQRSQHSLRVLLQSEYCLLGQALDLGDDR